MINEIGKNIIISSYNEINIIFNDWINHNYFISKLYNIDLPENEVDITNLAMLPHNHYRLALINNQGKIEYMYLYIVKSCGTFYSSSFQESFSNPFPKFVWLFNLIDNFYVNIHLQCQHIYFYISNTNNSYTGKGVVHSTYINKEKYIACFENFYFKLFTCNLLHYCNCVNVIKDFRIKINKYMPYISSCIILNKLS